MTDTKNTRQAILECLYENMQVNGFQGLRADKVIQQLGITKGALYHYFPDKLSMGYAVVDEMIAPTFLGYWQPLNQHPGNPLDYLQKSIRHVQKQFTEQNIIVGSPLSNLIQEMSPLDEGFRLRLQTIVDKIHHLVSDAIARGQAQGMIVKRVQAPHLAWFVLACFEGCYSVSKVSKSKQIFTDSLDELYQYLETLKA